MSPQKISALLKGRCTGVLPRPPDLICGSSCSSSQSTSSSWVNGKATTTTTLQFYVVGSSGRQALTSVRESSSGSSGSSVNVQVRCVEAVGSGRAPEMPWTYTD